MNKKGIFLLFFSIVALVLIATRTIPTVNNSQHNKNLAKLAVTRFPEGESEGNIAKLKLPSNLPNMPEKVMVYKVKKPNLSLEKVKETAKKLGIEGEVKENDKDFRVGSDKGEYIIDKVTGTENFITKEFELQNKSLTTVLSDEEYKDLAIQFLNEKGLMKDKAIFKDINKGNTITTTDANGVEKTLPTMIEVRFDREDLNNISFSGVGPKISVYFGDNGKIIGTGSVWRDVEPFTQYPIITAIQAKAEIEKGNAVVLNVDLEDMGTVKDIKLVYISDPIGYDQEFIIPHYLMSGTNQQGKSFTALTRAIPKEYIQENH